MYINGQINLTCLCGDNDLFVGCSWSPCKAWEKKCLFIF